MSSQVSAIFSEANTRAAVTKVTTSPWQVEGCASGRPRCEAARNLLTGGRRAPGSTAPTTSAATAPPSGSTTPAALTRTSTATFDPTNRRTRRLTPEDDTRYGYDQAGNLTGLTDSGGRVGYTYDPGRQLTSVAEPGASCRTTGGAVYTVDGGNNPVPRGIKCTVFSYDGDGNTEKVRYPTNHPTDTTNRGATVDADYDPSGRISKITAGVWPPSSARLLDLGYSYAAGTRDTTLIQTVTDASGPTTLERKASYDGVNQLTLLRATDKADPATTVSSERFCYDKTGNPTKYSAGPAATDCAATTGTTSLPATRTYDPGNELTSLAAGSRSATGTLTGTLAHDGNGSETTGPAYHGGPQRTHSPYSERDQDVQANSTTNTYAGPSQAKRLSRGGTTFGYNRTGIAWWRTGSTANAPVTYATRTPGGTLLGLRTGTRDTITTSYTSRYPLTDHLGSVRYLIRQDQAVSTSRTYSAYGQTLSQTSSDGYDNPIGYTGGYLDGDTGLYKLGIRYYDPALARFTQPDPTGLDDHYTYARNNPLNNTDPSGAETLEIGVEGCWGVCLCVGFAVDEEGRKGLTGKFGLGTPSVGGGVGISSDDEVNDEFGAQVSGDFGFGSRQFSSTSDGNSGSGSVGLYTPGISGGFTGTKEFG